MAEGLQRRLIGDPAHLAFEVTWPSIDPPNVEGLGWGGMVAWVEGRRHWAGAGDREPVSWTWIDLVEHLGRAWGALLFEEVAPFGLVASGPEELRQTKLLHSVGTTSPIDVEDQVHAYQHRHDLAAGISGMNLPPLWLLREGRTFRIRAEKQDAWRPVTEVSSVLEGIVDAIRERVQGAGQAAPRAVEAFRLWDSRNPSFERALRFRTASSKSELEHLTPPGQTLERWWGNPLRDGDTAMMAAARLSRPLPESTRRTLLSKIATLAHRPTPELDELTRAALAVLDSLIGLKPYEQGQTLAQWLRHTLKNEQRRFNPMGLLKRWGVELSALPDLAPEVDAIACWGAGRGPAVILNPKGKHASSPSGKRATLCHEICHLLVDRNRHLPAAEVMGGSTPRHLEQRARAFAAELLLPRAAAAAAVASNSSLASAADQLRAKFQVSNAVLGWQVKNGTGWKLLSDAEKGTVKLWCRQWQRWDAS